jgi:IgA Peptidase M64
MAMSNIVLRSLRSTHGLRRSAPCALILLPFLLACGSSKETDAPVTGGEGMPGDMNPTDGEPGQQPSTTDPVVTPEPGGNMEGMTGELPIAPVGQPAEPVTPPMVVEPPPAACSAAPLPPLAAFDCGSEGIVFENNGPHQNRVNYVILGDGYTEDMLDTVYPEHIRNMLTGTPESMFTQLGEPYLRYRKFINVCGLKVASNEACIDDQDTGQQCDSFFNTNGDDESRLARLGQAGQQLVDSTLTELLPADVDVDWIALTVNAGARNWWNSGGRFMLWNGSYEPRSRSASVALHEGGHAFHGLADEYGGNSCGNRNADQANVSNEATGAKWQVWLGFDHGPNNPEGTGAVGTGVQGAFLGALYCDTQYYRPSDNSQMNQLPDPFNMPSVDKIVRDIYEIVDPIDDLTDNATPLANPTEIRVRLVDPAVLKVDWSVDGTLVRENGGECFDAAQIAPGQHTVTAHVYDDTPWVRSNRAELEQTVSWTVNMQGGPPMPQ